MLQYPAEVSVWLETIAKQLPEEKERWKAQTELEYAYQDAYKKSKDSAQAWTAALAQMGPAEQYPQRAYQKEKAALRRYTIRFFVLSVLGGLYALFRILSMRDLSYTDPSVARIALQPLTSNGMGADLGMAIVFFLLGLVLGIYYAVRLRQWTKNVPVQ